MVLDRPTVSRIDEDRVLKVDFGRPEKLFFEGMPIATDSTLAARLEEQDMRTPGVVGTRTVGFPVVVLSYLILVGEEKITE